MHSEFLLLCGFAPKEIKEEAARIDRAFGILNIGSDDLKEAIERVMRSFDVELTGVRKALRIWIKELIDMVLAREEGKKIVYASFPPTYQLMAAMASASEGIYCIIPEVVLCVTMGCIFGKINSILETAENHGLAPGLAFCSFLQARLGAIVKGIIPLPDMLVPSCLLCDQSPKVDELLHEEYGIPVAYVDNIIEDKGDQWPTSINPRRVQYLASEITNATEKFSQIFGYRITEKQARQAIDAEVKLFRSANKVWELMKHDPIPLSLKDLEITRRIASICSRRALRDGIESLNTLYMEVEKRVKDGVGIMQKGAPRVMFTMVPFDPAVVAMIEELGLAIPVTSLAPSPTGSAKSSYTSVWDEVADSIMRRRGANYSSLAYILQVKELAERSNVDGVILFQHIGCRQYNAWILNAKEMIQNDLNIPVLLLEGDYCDTRNYNAQQMKNSVETFADIVKTAKAARGDTE